MRRAIIRLIKSYQLLLSPWVGRSCRFTPTCSQYGIDALKSHGTLPALWLTTRRLLRCHPWCEGGYDPVPTHDATPNSH
ncbi:MAG: membrane protein insertion efficiency factor YidD [Halieaceae bacterium]|nr:membrane protein insertion efficiency factor YidD [Halieaceae bacterium]